MESLSGDNKCPECGSKYNEIDYSLKQIDATYAEIHATCPECWKVSMIKAKVNQIWTGETNLNADQIEELKGKLKVALKWKVDNVDIIWGASSKQDSITDQEIQNINDELNNKSTIEDFLKNN